MQLSVYVYWGFFYSEVLERAHWIALQIPFAYGFHFALVKLRHRPYRLSLSLLPIVFSLNFFAWFREHYMWAQFALVAAGILGKEFLTRTIDGKTTHIFNPSALPLCILSLIIVIVGTEPWLMTQDLVASFLLVPHFFLYVFAVGSISQWFAGTTLIAFGSIFTLLSAFFLSLGLTGTPLLTAAIHPSVFLAITLLITDPATTPKTSMGRLLFGVGYGISIIVGYGLLSIAPAPTHLDKVLFVPLLNYLAPKFDDWGAKIDFNPSKFAQLAAYSILILSTNKTLENNTYLRPHILEPSREAQKIWRQPMAYPLSKHMSDYYKALCTNRRSQTCASLCFESSSFCH